MLPNPILGKIPNGTPGGIHNEFPEGIINAEPGEISNGTYGSYNIYMNELPIGLLEIFPIEVMERFPIDSWNALTLWSWGWGWWVNLTPTMKPSITQVFEASEVADVVVKLSGIKVPRNP